MQEGSARTTAMREALGSLHGQLEELRQDHKELQVKAPACLAVYVPNATRVLCLHF